MAKMGGSGKKEAKGKRKGAKGETTACQTCDKTGHIAARCREGSNNTLYAIHEEVNSMKKHLTTMKSCKCSLKESKHEQWQEVKRNVK